MDPNGKVALVTGSAMRMGRSIALALAGEGANLIIHYGGSAAQAAHTAGEIRALGREVLTVQADLARPAEIVRMFEAIRERFGRLDVLVNNAANFHRAPMLETPIELWDSAIAINLRAPFLCIQQAARLMRPGGGVIVNISDLAGVYAWRNYAAHGVSKAGLIHLTRQAARELAPDIRVNTIVPGPILPAPGAPQSQLDARAVEIPLQRIGAPGDVGQAVLFLIHSEFITGESILVDGGEALLGPAWH